MFPVTPAQWAHFLGGCGVKPAVAARWAEAFASECTPDRFNLGERELDDYIAETLHETAMLTATVENLIYSPARIRELGSLYGPTSRWGRAACSADELGSLPTDAPEVRTERAQALAEALYGGRFGNKNVGDGWKNRGRGIPMVTFADNYARLADLTGLPLRESPELLEVPANAVRASLCWWEDKIPDSAIDFPERVRRLVQGSTLGLDDTRKLAAAARANLPQENAA